MVICKVAGRTGMSLQLGDFCSREGSGVPVLRLQAPLLFIHNPASQLRNPRAELRPPAPWEEGCESGKMVPLTGQPGPLPPLPQFCR